VSRRSRGAGALPGDQVPSPVIARLRTICGALPEVVEEEAWTGTRWRVRGKTFAAVLQISDGWPKHYAGQAGTDGPATVVTFRSEGPELDALRNGGPPFWAPIWRADEVGLTLGDNVDWDNVDWAEIAELLTDSYCTQAPNKLAALVVRPDREDDDPSAG
jgi:YjbR